MRDAIVVKQQMKGNIIFCFLSVGMILASFLLVIIDFRGIIGMKFIDITIVYILLKVIFIFGVIFFGCCFLFLLKRIKTGKDIMVVDEKGITDNSSAISFGFIPWMDIDHIYIDEVMGSYFIELVINNEEKYLNTVTGIKKRSILANKGMGHQIVCITLNATGVSPHEILPRMLEWLHFSKQQRVPNFY